MANTAAAFANLNRHLFDLKDDYFYHLYLGKESHDLKEMFGDVKVSQWNLDGVFKIKRFLN